MLDYYLWVSVAVGIAQIFDCLIFISLKGRSSATGLFFSLTEWIWGGVSIYVLLQENVGLPKWLPGMYVAYLFIWSVYGIVIANQRRNMTNLTLTPKEALAGGLFGLLFALLSISLAIQ
jgi:hypothetical protein